MNRIGLLHIDHQAIDCIGISMSRREYIHVDSGPASLMATDIKMPMQSIPLAWVESGRSYA